MQRKIENVIVIGAGPAGLFAARRLAQKGMHVTVLEKESHVGGKCYTYSDPVNPEVKTEWGAALIAPNYGVVLDAAQEKKIEFEETLATDSSSVNFLAKFNSMSWLDKISFTASFVVELVRFTYDVSCYQYARDHLQPLPEDYDLPFSSFAIKHGLENINLLLKSFVTGFGYGLMEECPAYCVMEYMGLATLPAVIASPLRSGLVGIKNGMQTLMEKVAEDLDVVTSASISTIQRDSNGVMVTYQQQDKSSITTKADALILAISPVQWPKLGMELSETEQQCVNAVNYYHYPVAICEVDNTTAKHQYFPLGLEKEGLGHLALFTTRDNRNTHHRLGTAYINLPANNDVFTFDNEHLETLRQELQSQLPANDVSIVAHKIWEDYMPTLTWELRLQLENEQMRSDTNTLYAGAYTLGSFEDVACVSEQAVKAVDKFILAEIPTHFEKIKRELNRASFFYRQPRMPAVTEKSMSQNHNDFVLNVSII